MSQYRKAFVIAKFAHKKQRRYDGQMYFFHPYRVSKSLDREEDKCIALLHDVVENTNIKQSTIEKIFNKYISEGVKAMTRLPGVKYFDYIKNMPEKYKHIKLADIEDNFPTAKERMKERYEKAINILLKQQ